MAEPIVYHRGPEFPAVLARVFDAAEGRLPHDGDVVALHGLGKRGDGVGGRQSRLAGRPRRRRLGRLLRRALGADRRRYGV